MLIIHIAVSYLCNSVRTETYVRKKATESGIIFDLVVYPPAIDDVTLERV